VTNTPGIILGLKFVDFMGLKQYDWLGRRGKSSILEWEFFHDYYRFAGVIQIYFIISVNFLTGFFMINALWIPPLSIPTLSRMYTWFLLGNIVFKEGYVIIENRNKKKQSKKDDDPTNRWVVFGIILLEVAISIKFHKDNGNTTDDSMSPIVFYGWLLVFISIVSYYVYLRWIRKTDTELGRIAKIAIRRSPRKSASKKFD
jgi:hypothetical protein